MLWLCGLYMEWWCFGVVIVMFDRKLFGFDVRWMCGSNAFQDYFDDAKESRVKQVSRIKVKIQE